MYYTVILWLGYIQVLRPFFFVVFGAREGNTSCIHISIPYYLLTFNICGVILHLTSFVDMLGLIIAIFCDFCGKRRKSVEIHRNPWKSKNFHTKQQHLSRKAIIPIKPTLVKIG